MRTQNKIPNAAPALAKIGLIFAWAGVLIYAAANSIATVLIEIGAAEPALDGRNAITYTNLFLLGSVLSLVPILALFRADWSAENLRRLSRSDWCWLTLSAFLSSALTPGLFFYALEHSSVTSVVLVSRIEPPLFLLAAALFLKERIEPRAALAGLIALAGASIILDLGRLDRGGFWGLGETAAVLATLSYIASAITARKTLGHIPMGIFTIYRSAAGCLMYFALICILKGPQEFHNILSPTLLSWVWVYAIIVLVFGQLAWIIALKYARAGDVTLATSFSPLAAIIFAMLLLNETPGPGLLPGGALIIAAMVIGQTRKPTGDIWRGLCSRTQHIWHKRPTFAPGQIAQILVPSIALHTNSRGQYNGSY